MLGSGTTVGTCPSPNFINELDKIGDTLKFSYPLANFTCSFFMKVKCGAPAFEVVENGANYSDF